MFNKSQSVTVNRMRLEAYKILFKRLYHAALSSAFHVWSFQTPYFFEILRPVFVRQTIEVKVLP